MAASLAFAEALKRPDVVKGQFDLLYASLLGEGEQRPGKAPINQLREGKDYQRPCG